MKETCFLMGYPLYSWIFLVLKKTPHQTIKGQKCSRKAGHSLCAFPSLILLPSSTLIFQRKGLFIPLPSLEALAGISPASGYLPSSHGSPMYLARWQHHLQYKLSTWFLSEALFVEFVCGVGAEFAAPSGSV